ncbi:MAG: hypothetical protein B0W54_14055 [Cellvibrio sp. 79]|nr:MAG: hypothetical protein B0W54_14055 [Cellvibrio sp. 79]
MRLLIICWMVLLAGCAHRQHYQLEDLPLPAAQGKGCCWQATQQLEIHYKHQVYRLGAALARTTDGVSLVLLDPVGRRLFSIRQRGEQLETYRSAELPEDLPGRFLLASSMLAWWPASDWNLLQGSEWSLVSDVSRRELRYRAVPLVTITYGPQDGTATEAGLQGKSARLEHHKIPLGITVVTTQWKAL